MKEASGDLEENKAAEEEEDEPERLWCSVRETHPCD